MKKKLFLFVFSLFFCVIFFNQTAYAEGKCPKCSAYALHPQAVDNGYYKHSCDACGYLGSCAMSVTTTDATCTTAGSKTGTCWTCYRDLNETIPALGHSWSGTASCTSTATCTRCNATSGGYGHSRSWTSYCSTCKYSYGSYRCSSCGNTSQTRAHSNHSHSYAGQSCTSGGTCCCGSTAGALGHSSSWSDYCSTCSYYYGSEICSTCSTITDTRAHSSHSSHTYSGATCVVSGTCCCGATGTVGHTQSSSWTSDIYHHWKVCTVCSTIVVSKTEHTGIEQCTVCGEILYHDCNFSSQTVTSTYLKTPATCTEKAVYYYKCTICNDMGTETYEYGEPNGHSPSDWKLDGNQHWKTCTVCSEIVSAKTNHTFTAKDTSSTYLKSEATCTARAVYYYKCSICPAKATTTYEHGETLPHTEPPEWTTSGTHHWKVCTVCSNIIDEKELHTGEDICPVCGAYVDQLPRLAMLNWDTTGDTEKSISLITTGGFIVKWGDGTSTTSAKSDTLTHTYSSSGIYTVRILSESTLKNITVPEEKVTEIKVETEDLEELHCQNNSTLTTIDISPCLGLKKLSIRNTGVVKLNSPTAIDLSEYTEFTDGWYTRTESSQLSLGNVGDRVITINSNTVSEALTYTVSYRANEGINEPCDQTKLAGENLTLSSSEPARSNHTFLGWALTATAPTSLYDPGDTFTADEDTVLYAVWEKLPDKYMIIYSAGQGTGAPQKQIKPEGETLILRTEEPTREGYKFAGWSTEEAATTVTHNPGGEFTIDADTILYAVWLEKYTVSFNAGAGTNPPANQIKVHSETLTLTTDEPTREGYKFSGWSTEETATTVTHNPGGEFTIEGNTTLYAVWLKKYTITFDAGLGTNPPASQIKVHDETLILTTDIPIREEYDFVGWSTEQNTETPMFTAGGEYTLNGDQILYAVWQESSRIYMISYNANGGTRPPATQYKNRGETLILTLQVPERQGYAFIGWNTDSTATTVEYQPGGEFTLNKDKVLYAIWQQETPGPTYNLKIEVGGLFISAPYPANTTVYLAPIDVPGKSFSNWVASGVTLSDPTNPWATFVMPANNVTITSVYTIYTVRTEVNGIFIETTQTSGTEVGLEVQDLNGRVFDEWVTDDAEIDEPNQESTTFTMPYNNVTVEGTYKNSNKLTINLEDIFIWGETEKDATVTITESNDVGRTFETWSSDDITITNPTNNSITITMPDKGVTIDGKYLNRHMLTTRLDDIYINAETDQGTQVTITGDDTSGAAFTGWTGTDVTISGSGNESITITMPDNDAEITGGY